MTRSDELFERAQAVIPGGVNSPVRAFGGVGGTPVFVERGLGRYAPPTSTARSTSTSCSRGGRSCSATRARRSSRRPSRRRREGHVVRRADRGRGRARRAARRRAAVPRDGSARQQRHRGRDERDPAGARRHRPRQAPEVRGVLPRPLRLAARAGRRQRARDTRHPGLGRRHRGRRAATRSSRRTTTSRPSSAAFDEWGGDIAVVDRRAGRRQHGRRPARGGLPRGRCASSARSTARCCCSTR